MTATTVAGCGSFQRSQDTSGLPRYVAEPGASTVPAHAVASSGSGQAVDAASSDAADALVASISLTDKDVRKLGGTVHTAADGDTVDGGSTLAGCAEDYPSEAHRVARRRVDVAGDDAPDPDSAALASEVVAYDSAKAAERALQEWRTSMSDCPFGARTEVLGIRDLRFDSVDQRTASSLPASDNCVTSTTLTGHDRTAYGYSVLQRHGNVLAMVTLASLEKPTKADSARVNTLAKVLGRRLVSATG